MNPARGSLLGIEHLEAAEILRLLKFARRMNPDKPRPLLKGKRVLLLFYEASTRTRSSFEIAAKSLGAHTVLIQSIGSSIEKGESLLDTGYTVRAVGADIIVIRHPNAGAPYVMAQHIDVPVINAGDGLHEHPSQALLDAYTILRNKKTFKGLQVAIVGDIFHSRVARSACHLLSKFGVKIILCGPPELVPDIATTLAPGVRVTRHIEDALRGTDVVMLLRVQTERLSGMKIDLAGIHRALPDDPGPLEDGEEGCHRDASRPDHSWSGTDQRSRRRRPGAHPGGSAQRRAHAHGDSGAGDGEDAMTAQRKHRTSLLIKGGHLIDPAARIDAPMDVLLKDGRVAEVAPPNKIKGGADEKFDARGLIVAPGFIDLHAHLREPGQAHKETIATGTAAAAAGGFTSVCTMPNTVPVVDSVEWIEWLRQPERGAVVNVFAIAAATRASKGATLTDFRALHTAGAIAVTDDGKPILEDSIMREALVLGGELNFPVVQHAEDTRMTENCSMHAGARSFRLGLRGMTAAAEASIVERDVQLAMHIPNARLHVAHLSTADALKSVRRGKRAKARVTFEVTPHHFTLTDEDMRDYDSNYKMNPPLRSASDREAILAALADGTVDAIATDHAPHAAHEKEMEFERAAFGITGLETALALAITRLHREKRIPLARIVELFTAGPARCFDLRGRGSLVRGSVADVTVFDPKKKWTFDAAKSRSKSRNTPFDGWQLTGKVVATIVGGKIVYSGH